MLLRKPRFGGAVIVGRLRLCGHGERKYQRDGCPDPEKQSGPSRLDRDPYGLVLTCVSHLSIPLLCLCHDVFETIPLG